MIEVLVCRSGGSIVTWGSAGAHSFSVDPVSGHEERQIGRKIGSEIVQVGVRVDGTPTRWRFTEITADSFHWLGEALVADGATWKLEGEFRDRRVR
jgi:hypothetical protein